MAPDTMTDEPMTIVGVLAAGHGALRRGLVLRVGNGKVQG
jgi:hypothetical protein